MYDRILIPLDGSSHAEAAIAVAQLIPCRLVYLLRVEQDPPQIEHHISPTGREVQTRVVFHSGGEYLERIGDTLRAQGRQVEALQTSGAPADRIIETAADANLIVMATHGRGAAGRALLGSVADRVVREAPAPVLLVRSGDRPTSPPITRIVVPLDGSELAEEALPTAVALATALDLRVHLVQVVEPLASGAGTLFSGRGRRAAASATQTPRTYLEDCAERLRDEVTTTWELRSGAVLPELWAAIRPRDVVVMTTRGHSGFRRLILGSVANALVREASAPVLPVRAGMADSSERYAE